MATLSLQEVMQMRQRMIFRKTVWASVVGFFLLAPSVHAAPPVSFDNDACNNPSAEARLRQREAAVLGPAHADSHARARAKQCRVAAGLDRVATPDDQVLAAAKAQATNTAGQWSAPFVIPVVGITAVLLHTGKVLFWSYEPTQYHNPAASNTGVAYVWDPATRTGHPITPPENIWCAGQTILSDGRVFIAGGNLRYPDPNAPEGQQNFQGALSSYTFNPLSESWTTQPNMSVGRWYPTVTKLADNRVVITSGLDETGSGNTTSVVELFTPAAGMDSVGTMSTVSLHHPSGMYPFQYLLGSGQMMQAGPAFYNTVLLTPGAWSWSSIPNMLSSHYEYANGVIYTDASVTPVKQAVMIAGGAEGDSAFRNNEWFDVGNPNAGWRQFPQWLQPRHNANTVILPDGTLFTVGGNAASNGYDNPHFDSELYNKPAGDPTGTWIPMSPNTIQAGYHSSAILLPDATVLLSQDDMNPLAASTHQAQVYSPPYLFKGARPNISSAPGTLSLGQTFTVGSSTPNVSSVALVAPGAVTHGNDMHQRYIKLRYTKQGAKNLRVTLPASSSLVPPGYYMLFIIDSQGVPSVAKFVRVS
ncbi:DUF1929 domain-containing protein [Cupriavidus sp. WGtm5]|uniref:galactose oxidase-like domain-containing protein n=1 Tax=Cupriavidus sp. WGtm5 TaxID=2919926 RepID=UPI0020908685|nr:galactose oxidase-like domain-containing protein [Cupriavidus sp. WGtm5]MCO4893143.1 DUF1929 domain-containing protein [Cupriavidus sp. WGtm5]